MASKVRNVFAMLGKKSEDGVDVSETKTELREALNAGKLGADEVAKIIQEMLLNQIAVTEDRAKLNNELTALHHNKKFVPRLAKQVQEIQKKSYTMLSVRYLPLLSNLTVTKDLSLTEESQQKLTAKYKPWRSMLHNFMITCCFLSRE